ncbi:MAG: hypothetical protein HYR94_17325 [Chloroflexi bacterium]|nr:hypothetical protein [Chloroflexota bacterium]
MEPTRYARGTRSALSLLGQATQHAIWQMSGDPYYHAYGVLHAAQAGEIIIKSCIAKQQPLHIFKNISQPDKKLNQQPTIIHLLESGKNLNYSELPDVLFEITGYTIPELNLAGKVVL